VIHVSAAASLGPDLGIVVAYDARFVAAAEQRGLAVVSPS
jgi:predicted nucleic acid-binding protein